MFQNCILEKSQKVLVDAICNGRRTWRHSIWRRSWPCLQCAFQELWLLLHTVKGPTSFKDLRARLLENDNQWNETLKEAAHSDSPSKIRTHFAIILWSCEPSNPKALWDNSKDCMSEDILNILRGKNPHIALNYTDGVYNEALTLIRGLKIKSYRWSENLCRRLAW